MADNKFQENVNSLLAGMDHFLTTKSVVGDAIHLDENTVLLPLVDMVPDFVNRFASMRSSHVSDDDVRKAAFQEEE